VNTSSRNTTAVRSSRLAPVLVCLLTVLGLPVHAAVSFPDTPMQTNNGVPPNLWFILDDSGSMTFTAMPNDRDSYGLVRDRDGNVVTPVLANSIGDRSYVNNTIYYNPNKTYQPWQRTDGTYFTGGTAFNSVYTHPTKLEVDDNIRDYAGNDVGTGLSEDLRTTTQEIFVPRVANPGTTRSNYYRYRIISTGAATNPGRIQRCERNAADTAWDQACTFATPTGRTEAQEKANYAVWFSYHRTRMKVAKAGVSYAFNDTSIFNPENRYRAGFTTIHDRNTLRIPVGTDDGLFRGNADGENRKVWFDRLFAADASSNTPLIPALTRAGEYFEEVGADGPWGPQANGEQYQCRQNFSILTTDGFWNNGSTSVGDEDSTSGESISRPDGGDSYQYSPSDPFQDSIANTLADVAMHYWKRDLRIEADMTNIVPTSASNPAFWQHMVTFGIAIGLSGTLDVPATKTKVKNEEAVSWPNPVDRFDSERIDDLFHAAVNGHGDFIAASDPDEFSDGLGNALRAISARRGSGSNATVSGTTAGGSTKVFQARYFSAKWYGELQAFPVTATGINTATPLWTANFPTGIRSTIFTHNGTGGPTFPTTTQTTGLGGTDFTNYLRGDRTKEEPRTGALFRERTSLLGSIVNSSPAFVQTSPTVDTVYVGANDGMLHAFDATSGLVRFSYVPRGIDLNRLKEYGESDYGHRFFVDGPIVTSTTRELAAQTVLVGTLGRGGIGLFALDVTNPTAFATSKVLWDNSGQSENGDMGQILGKPLIAKTNDGSTVLITGNGLNSSRENAVLYVFNLTTGALIKKIDTGIGGSNGLSAPRGWDDDGNGTVDIVYAGDFRGNLWKFDLSSTSAASWNVAAGRPLFRPDTGTELTKPVTGGVTIAVDPATDKRWVFFGTGRLLTFGDITDTTLQTWYGVIDENGDDISQHCADQRQQSRLRALFHVAC
jgi:type IV pilus assembly protein PilY1